MLRLTNAFIIHIAATLGACSGYGGATSPIPNDGHVSIQRTFATAGNYHYTCHIHPGMQGTVVVQ